MAYMKLMTHFLISGYWITDGVKIMGLLANSKEKKKQKYHNQFISLYDSVLYLGEPMDESLQFIIEIMPYQSCLYLGSNGLQAVFIDDDIYSFNGIELYKGDIISQLTKCITKETITPASPIYNLGFGKKRFLSYLLQNDIEPPQKDIETAQSPDLFFDDYPMDGVDYYTLQAIIDERDELRKKVENQANNAELATKTKNTVAKIILALFELGELDWKDSDPYDYSNPQSLNNQILIKLQSLNLEVSNRVIGDWIKLAKEQA